MANKIFLVYCAENQDIASGIAQDLSRLDVRVQPDTREAGTREETLQLMSSSGAPVVLLVTDNFLKSVDCMDHFSEFLKTLENQLIIVTADGRWPDADHPGGTINTPTVFESVNEVMQYRDYWYECWIRLRKQRATLPEAEQASMDEAINIAQKTSTTTGSFLRILREQHPLTLGQFQSNQFAAFFAKAGFEAKTNENETEEATMVFAPPPPVNLPATPEPLATFPESEAFERIVSKAFDGDDATAFVPNVSLPSSEKQDISVSIFSEESEDDHYDAAEDEDLMAEGEDEGLSHLSETYVESVTKEMEKAARIVKEIDGEQLPDEPVSTDSDEENFDEDEDDDEDEITGLQTPEHPAAVADRHYGDFLANPPKNPLEAISQLQEIVAIDNQHEEAYRHLAELTAAQGSYQDAVRHYERVISLQPGDEDAYFKAARLLDEHLGEKEKAASYYKNALYLEHNNSLYHYHYAVLLNDFFEKEKKAAKHFKHVVELDNSNAHAHLALGKLYLDALEKPEKGLKHYTFAIAIAPELQTPALDELFGYQPPADEAQESDKNIAPRGETINLPALVGSSAAAVAMVTGATSGIGKAIATLLAQKGCSLILTGRRTERLEALKAELETAYGNDIHLLSFDVRDQQAVATAIDSLPEAWQSVDVLVNNAGLAKGLSTIDEGELEHWDMMIDTNVKGLLYVTRAVAPGMVARKSGHIINISSTAAKEVYPKGNVYCATKFAVDALNRGMRMDLCPHNIRVTAISPGHTEDTEFALVRFDDAERAKIYDDFQPLKAEDVAEAVWFALSRPLHVNINEIVLSSTQQASSTVINRSGR